MDTTSQEVPTVTLKVGIKFEHLTNLYDPDLREILNLQQETKVELEDLILHHFGPFWLEASGPKQTASFGFYFHGARVHVQYQFYNMPQFIFVEWRSKKLIEENARIGSDFLPQDPKGLHDYSHGVSLEEVIDQVSQKGELFPPDFQDKIPELSTDTITSLLHFTADPNIAKLVVMLNKLQIHTLHSCEGHDSTWVSRKFPTVGFPNIMLFRLLSCLKDWPGKTNRNIMIRYFIFPSEGFDNEMFNLSFEGSNLIQNQELTIVLAEYLEEKLEN